MTRRAVVVIVLLGLFAVDCCNATAEWAWSDITKTPHIAAVHAPQPAVAGHDDAAGAILPPAVPTILLVLVLLFVFSADRRPRWTNALATGPPRRGPPPISVLLPRSDALEIEEKDCEPDNRTGWRRGHPAAVA